jgi:hypothetical protein
MRIRGPRKAEVPCIYRDFQLARMNCGKKFGASERGSGKTLCRTRRFHACSAARSPALEHARDAVSGVEAGKKEVEPLYFVAFAGELGLRERIANVTLEDENSLRRPEQAVSELHGHFPAHVRARR